MPSITRILKRWDDFKAERSTRDTLHQEIADYTIPQQSNIIITRIEGQKQTEKLFDSTAIHSSGLLAASLHGTMTPSTQPWLSLRMRDEELNTVKEVADWLEEVARRLHLALRQSNFNTAVHEMYRQLVNFATGVLFMQERPLLANGQFAGFQCQSVAWGAYAIAEDPEGRVDTLYRVRRMPRRSIIDKWPKAAFPKEFVDKARQKPDERAEVLHAVEPRRDRAYTVKGPKPGSKNMPWASCYLLVSEKILLDEGGFEEFPYMVPRWGKDADETYGTGIGHIALPDIKTLNAAKEFLLKAAPLAMFPPTVEKDESVLGDPDLTPGGRNVVSGQGAMSDLFGFLEPRGRLDMTQLVLADLKQSIKEMYFVPQLQLQDGPQMTATEVQVRWELMQRFLGPTVGRLEAEFLNPLVERCFGIMARANALPPVPEALRQLGAMADIDVEYEGPLARAQRTIELTAQARVIGFAMQIDEKDPTSDEKAMDILDIDSIMRDRANITGLPSKNVRGEEQVEAKRAGRRQARQTQEQMAQTEQMAGAAGKAAPMLKELQAAAISGQNGSQR